MSGPETALTARGRCEGCRRIYRLPRPDRAYTCKACGGAVHVVEGEPPAERTHEETARLRHETQRTMKRAHEMIDFVRWSYRLGALAYGVATIFAVLALAKPEVPEGEGVLVVVLTTSLSIAMGMGAMHMLFRPFVWAVGIALLATAITAVHGVGPNPYGLAGFGSAAWALFAWVALVPVKRFERLIREHKDLYILQHASARTRRSLKGRTAADRHDRLLLAMRRAARRTWRLSTAIAVLVALSSAGGTWLALEGLREPVFANYRSSFESAWNDEGLSGVEPLLDERIRASESARLAAWTAGLGWGDGLPALETGEERAEDGGFVVDYGGDAAIHVRWVQGSREWSIERIDLPPPPLDPYLEGFLEAWHDSDAEGVVTYFSEGKRTVMLTNVREAVARQGWEEYPTVIESRVEDRGEETTTVTLALVEGEVETRWHLRPDGTWGLELLRFPSRKVNKDQQQE